MLIKILGRFNYQTFPIENCTVDVLEADLKEIGKTKCFDVENQKIIDYIKPLPTQEELQIQYTTLVEKYIRQKYTVSAEFAILRQKDAKPEEFDEYYTYAESCKARAKQELGL